ncbi:MAG: sensor domain-containing diguanylate cyclase [Kiritimatiellae bacterium]|nr:sensor domain-containing diguanylate cyclase [Kiritimatiellia bacterium]
MNGKTTKTLGNWLFHVFREADGSLALEEALHVVMDSIKDYFPCQSMAVILIDEDTNEMRIKISRQISYSFVKKFSRAGPGPAVFRTVLEQQPLHIERAEPESPLYREVKLEHDFTSAILVPIIKRQRGVGFIFTDRGADHEPFDEPDVLHLQVLGYLIGNLMEKFEILKATKHLSKIDDASKALKYDAFVEAFATETERARTYTYSLILALMDIDAFRKFVETYGIDRAHELLAEVVNVAKRHIRDMDILARFGAAEFVLCLSGMSRSEAEGLLRTIRDDIQREVATDSTIPIAVAIGILPLEDERSMRRPFQELMAALGKTLVEAKNGPHDGLYVAGMG